MNMMNRTRQLFFSSFFVVARLIIAFGAFRSSSFRDPSTRVTQQHVTRTKSFAQIEQPTRNRFLLFFFFLTCPSVQSKFDIFRRFFIIIIIEGVVIRIDKQLLCANR